MAVSDEEMRLRTPGLQIAKPPAPEQQAPAAKIVAPTPSGGTPLTSLGKAQPLAPPLDTAPPTPTSLPAPRVGPVQRAIAGVRGSRPADVIDTMVFDDTQQKPAELPQPVVDNEPSLIKETGKGFARGTLSLAESVGTGLRFLGGKIDSDTIRQVGETTEDYWANIGERYNAHESLQGSVVDNPALLRSGSWWAYNVANIVPSLAASIIPGAAAARAAKLAGHGIVFGKSAGHALARSDDLTKFVKVGNTIIHKTPDVVEKMARIGRAARFAGAATGGLVGGALEGSSTYRETYDAVMQQGGTQGEAEDTAEVAAMQMTAASGVLNSLSVGRFLKKLKAKPGEKLTAGQLRKRKLAAKTINGLVEGITEYLEGPAEAGIMYNQNVITPEEAIQKMKDEVNVLGPAAVAGFFFPVSGEFASTKQGGKKKGEAEPPGTPPPTAENVNAEAETKGQAGKGQASQEGGGQDKGQPADETPVTVQEVGQKEAQAEATTEARPAAKVTPKKKAAKRKAPRNIKNRPLVVVDKKPVTELDEEHFAGSAEVQTQTAEAYTQLRASDTSSLSTKSAKDIRAVAATFGVPTSGKKADVIKRVVDKRSLLDKLEQTNPTSLKRQPHAILDKHMKALNERILPTMTKQDKVDALVNAGKKFEATAKQRLGRSSFKQSLAEAKRQGFEPETVRVEPPPTTGKTINPKERAQVALAEDGKTPVKVVEEEGEAPTGVGIQQALFSKRSTPVNTSRDSLLTAITKLGGINSADAISEGIDPADKAYRGFEFYHTFHKYGDTMDGMAERLAEHGYPVKDEDGNANKNTLLDAVYEELQGSPKYAPDGWDYQAQLMAEQREQDYYDQLEPIQTTSPSVAFSKKTGAGQKPALQTGVVQFDKTTSTRINKFLTGVATNTAPNPFNRRGVITGDTHIELRAEPESNTVFVHHFESYHPQKGGGSKALDMLVAAADESGVVVEIPGIPYKNIAGRVPPNHLDNKQMDKWLTGHGFERVADSKLYRYTPSADVAPLYSKKTEEQGIRASTVSDPTEFETTTQRELVEKMEVELAERRTHGAATKTVEKNLRVEQRRLAKLERRLEAKAANKPLFSKKKDEDKKAHELSMHNKIEQAASRVGQLKRVTFSAEERQTIETALVNAKGEVTEEEIASVYESIGAAKRDNAPSAGWQPLELIGVERNDKGILKPKYKPIPYNYHLNPKTNRFFTQSKPEQAQAQKRKQHLATGLVQEVKRLMGRAARDDEAAKTMLKHQKWYSDVRIQLRQVFGAAADMVADVLGASSPGLQVALNVRYAMEAMQSFSSGKYDKVMEEFADYIEAGGQVTKYKGPKVTRPNGKKFGKSDNSTMLAMAKVWSIVRAGDRPKARNFSRNLIGLSDDATIDVWAARLLQRLANNGKNRIPVRAETGIGGEWNKKGKATGQYGFAQDVFAIAGKELGMAPHEVQALAWFMEKELWSKNRWTKVPDGSVKVEVEERELRRFLAGTSQQTEGFFPIQAEDNKLGDAIRKALGGESIIAMRAASTLGMYMGKAERSLDVELTVAKDYDEAQLVVTLVQQAEAAQQQDVFISEVLPPDHNSPNARPGIEVYFKDETALEDAQDVINTMMTEGLDGFTMTVDPRATLRNTDFGKNQQSFVGVRLQYVPEITVRYADELSASIMSDDAALGRDMERVKDQIDVAAAKLLDMPGVAHVQQADYNTLVIGRENYGEYNTKAAAEHQKAKGIWFQSEATGAVRSAIKRYQLAAQATAKRNKGNLHGRGKQAEAKEGKLAAPIPLDRQDGGVESQHEIYGRFGQLVENKDTTNDLKIYNLTSLVANPKATTDKLLQDLAYTVKVFSFDEQNFVLPKLGKQNYNTGVVWIYDPQVEHGSFKDTEYTRAWRITHEVGHGLTEAFLDAKYQKSRRYGRLGRTMKGERGVPPKRVEVKLDALTLKEAQRAVEWEDLAFRAQRMLLEDMGVQITEQQFAHEYNTNISDAVYRVVTGDFGNPGEYGFTPSETLPNLREVLESLQATEQLIAKNEKRKPTEGINLKEWMPVSDERLRAQIERRYNYARRKNAAATTDSKSGTKVSSKPKANFSKAKSGRDGAAGANTVPPTTTTVNENDIVRSQADAKPRKTKLVAHELRAHLFDDLKRLQRLMPVEVIQSLTELPENLRYLADDVSAGSIEGIFHDGQVFLVADNLESMQRAEKVFAHEVFGHQAMEKLPGFDKVVKEIQRLIKGKDAEVLRLRDRVRASQPGLDAITEAKEIIAQMSEEGDTKRASFRRVMGIMKQFIRALGFRSEFSSDEVRLLIRMNKRRVEKTGDALTILAQQPNSPALEDIRNLDVYQQLVEGKVDAKLAAALSAVNKSRSPLFARVMHGSHQRFMQFKTEAIGTGEGTMAFGWGLYFAEFIGVANHYRKRDAAPRLQVGHEQLGEASKAFKNKPGSGLIVINDPREYAAWLILNDTTFPLRNRAWSLESDIQARIQQAMARYDDRITMSKEVMAVAGLSGDLAKEAQAELARDEKIYAALVEFADTKDVHKATGYLYEVEIADEITATMMDWNAPLSAQPESVQKLIRSQMSQEQAEKILAKYEALAEESLANENDTAAMDAFVNYGNSKEYAFATFVGQPTTNGGDFYKAFGRSFDGDMVQSQKQASLALNAMGIPGHKFFDAYSRDGLKEDPTRNLVVYDETIVTVVKRNGEDINNIEDDLPPLFSRAVRQAVEEKLQPKATAQQYANTLRRMSTQGYFPKEVLEDSNILSYLEEEKPFVIAQRLLPEATYKIQRVSPEEAQAANKKGKQVFNLMAYQRNGEAAQNWWVEITGAPLLDQPLNRMVRINKIAKAYGVVDSRMSTKADAVISKEQLLTALDEMMPTISVHEQSGAAGRRLSYDPTHGMWESLWTFDMQEPAELLFVWDQAAGAENVFDDDHWDVPGVLAHARIQKFKREDGTWTLHVDEIQSDWHQRGRAQGYFPKNEDLSNKDMFVDTEVSYAPYKKTWPTMVVKEVMKRAQQEGIGVITWTDGEQQEKRNKQPFSRRTQTINAVYVSDFGTSPRDESVRTVILQAEGVMGELVKLPGIQMATQGEYMFDEPRLLSFFGKKNAKAIWDYYEEWSTSEYSGEELKLPEPVVKRSPFSKFYDLEIRKAFEKAGKTKAKHESKLIPFFRTEEMKRIISGKRFATRTDALNFIEDVAEVNHLAKEDLLVRDLRRPEFPDAFQVIYVGSGGKIPAWEMEIKPDANVLFSRRRAEASDVVEKIRSDRISTHHTDRSLLDRAKDLVSGIINFDRDAVTQGMIDSGNAIKMAEIDQHGELLDASVSAYKQYHTTRNLHSVLGAIMQWGVPKYVDDEKTGGGGFREDPDSISFMDVFAPVSAIPGPSQLANWELYAAAIRANRLLKKKNPDGSPREKNFTQAEVDVILKWVAANPNLKKAFDETNEKLMQFNSEVLGLAESQGVINAKSRKLWEENLYVPFYRAMESVAEGDAAPRTGRGISQRWHGIKTLTGKDEKVQGSIFENLFMNMAHLVDSSYKAQAMKRIIELGLATDKLSPLNMDIKAVKIPLDQLARALRKAGLIIAEDDAGALKELKRLPKKQREEWATLFRPVAPVGDNVVANLVDGKAQYYAVDDPLFLRSIAGIDPRQHTAMMDLMRGSKHWLTTGVTADPAFMLANYLRDTLSAWVISDVKMTPFIDSIKGVRKAWNDSPEMREMMYAGRGGGGFYDTNPDDARKLLTKFMPKRDVHGFMRTIVSPMKAWEFWKKVGNASEFANRMAIFDAVRKEGGSVDEAAYRAQDVLNFTRSGDYYWLQTLVQSVPFMNARIQGLNRLYRGAKEHPMGFAMKGSMIMMASIALALKNLDDDRYKELPEWDKDVYWHYWAGDQHFRIPKPFEVGVLFATVPERVLNLLTGNDHWKTSVDRGFHAVSDTFAMNPIPQLFRPLIEQYANKTFFTGSPIVGYGLSQMPPEAQYEPYSPEFMRVLAEAMPDDAPAWLRSPKRLEAAVRGYFGALGTYAMMATSEITRLAGGYPDRPARELGELPVLSRFKPPKIPRSTKYNDILFEMRDEAQGIANAINKYRQEQNPEKALKLRADNASKLATRKALNRLSRKISDVRKKLKRVYTDPSMTAEKKRELVDLLQQKQNELYRQSERFMDAFE